MNELNILFAANPTFKFVTVTFANSSRAYTYKTTLDLEPGDFVIVNTPSTGFTCAEVTDVLSLEQADLKEGIRYKWVVQKVDAAYYDEVKAMEQEVQKAVNDNRRTKMIKAMKKELEDNLGKTTVKQIEKLVRL